MCQMMTDVSDDGVRLHPVHCKIFNSISGLHCLDASSMHVSKVIPDIAKYPLGNKTTPVENCCSRISSGIKDFRNIISLVLTKPA